MARVLDLAQIGNCKFWGVFLQERPLSIQKIITNKHLLIDKRYNNLVECHTNYAGLNIFIYLLEVDISRNSSKDILDVLT